MPHLLLLALGDCRLLLDAASSRLGGQRGEGGGIDWTPPLPAPLRLVGSDADVAYHHLWSGISEVALPHLAGDGALCCWLVDGEDQLLLIRIGPEGTVTIA